MRKVLSTTVASDCLIAVCNDGTIWAAVVDGRDMEWKQCNAPPQVDEEQDEYED